MRVLQLHTLYREPGGEDAVVRAEAALLTRLGHEVVQLQERNPADAVRAALALAFAPWNPLSAHRVRHAAEELRPDVAHVHNTWYGMSPAVFGALRDVGVPVIVTLHNFRPVCANAQLFRDGSPCEDCVGSHPWHGVRHGCYRGSVVQSIPAAGTIALHRRLDTWKRAVDLFVVLNEFSRERFVRGGLPAGRILVKPNFVTDPGPRTTPTARSPTVLYVGRLAPEKGLDALVEAWRLLEKTSLELVVIGDGPLRARLERLAVPGIHFEGRLPEAEVHRRMLAARALVLPSIWYEGQPMAVLEAFAAGLPVLSSAIGGMTELVGPLGDGWLTSAGDAAAWAAALRRLEDPVLARRGGERARALYERAFSEAKAGTQLEATYERAQRYARSRA
jgi:glycosyltransferase involved in cell wall biosynthesis